MPSEGKKKIKKKLENSAPSLPPPKKRKNAVVSGIKQAKKYKTA